MKKTIYLTFFILLFFAASCPAEEKTPPADSNETIAQTSGAGGTEAETEEEKPAETTTKNGQTRDPFSQVASEIIKPDHDRAAECCLLRGIIRAGGQARGLFAVSEEADNWTDTLHPLAPGEKLRIRLEESVYVFTVSWFDRRKAVIIGENEQKYDVRL